MLIPDTEYGFSGPYAIALTSAWLGKSPDILKAIQITEDYINAKNEYVPKEIIHIIREAKRTLPGELKHEMALLINEQLKKPEFEINDFINWMQSGYFNHNWMNG
jgi:hypothetical protein